MQDSPFLGSWRQVSPSPSPATINVHFHDDGRLLYRLELNEVQEVVLTWRVEGDLLVIGEERRSRWDFRSPSVLVLENEHGRFVYERNP